MPLLDLLPRRNTCLQHRGDRHEVLVADDSEASSPGPLSAYPCLVIVDLRVSCPVSNYSEVDSRPYNNKVLNHHKEVTRE